MLFCSIIHEKQYPNREKENKNIQYTFAEWLLRRDSAETWKFTLQHKISNEKVKKTWNIRIKIFYLCWTKYANKGVAHDEERKRNTEINYVNLRYYI